MITSQPSLHMWHRRLGHPNFRSLKLVLNNFSLPYCSTTKFDFCNSCSSNKSHRLSFFPTSLQSTHPLHILYSDVWGPSPILSLDKNRYYVVFVDHYTKYSWLYTLKNKSDVKSIFPQFQALVERYFNHKIKSLYTDGGGEFNSLKSYLASQGIEYLKSPPYTPQRVAFAERKHRHIIETTRTILHQAHLPSVFWSFACRQAVYLINRLPAQTNGNVSPYQSLFQTPPNYNNIRIFGCLCYPWLKPYVSSKLKPRSTPCVYLGFSTQYYVHQCFDPATSKVYISRDVLFHEDTFPYTNIFTSYKSPPTNIDWVPIGDMHTHLHRLHILLYQIFRLLYP